MSAWRLGTLAEGELQHSKVWASKLDDTCTGCGENGQRPCLQNSQ